MVKKRDWKSNLCFADDVLMMANAVKQLKKMIEDFKKSTEAQGLEIHPSKNKILTNHKTNKLRVIEIDEMHVEILPHEGKAKCLEEVVTFVDKETTEVQHRIRWRGPRSPNIVRN